MNKTIRTFLAIACGVAIGLAVEPVWQWLAPIIGGIIAYLVVNIRGAVSAVPRAWEMVYNWDYPTKEEREYIRWWVYAWLSTGMTFGLSILGLFVILKPANFNEESYLTCVLMGIYGGFFMFLVLLTEAERKIPDDLPKSEQTRRGLQELKRIVRASFPFVILFYHLPRGMWWLGRYGIPRFVTRYVPIAARLVWQWFRLVHSDVRLLCFVDAALFTGIGLLAGGPIAVWAIGGGIFGVFNYQIVSVHWLKLVPR